MSMKTIIHAHFYQPDRQAPWANIVLNQKSATPYSNWNERIIAECYAPNCYSRVLDNNGKITNIINNLEYISFNFGPLLLNYIENTHNDLYNAIIEADKKSVATHGGHGNAVAMVYNHIIMSLASFQDKKTQIIWALKDFEHRFGRQSEGMWLSECAIDYQTIDLLIENGVKFVVLSSKQAEAFSGLDEDSWHYYDDELKVDTTVAYKITRAGGSLAVFYYDEPLSAAVSFEHLLRDASNFAGRILHSQDVVEPETDEEKTEGEPKTQQIKLDNHGDPLVVIATDGEIYGHHEPFGDMCLSSLISNYCTGEGKQIELLNFAQYLEIYPPQYETLINLGEDNRGSSWSCPHGTARWYRDCGCKVGGEPSWTQGWRTPLREAFDLIKAEADDIFVRQTRDLFDDTAQLRNNYIEFILNDYDTSKLDFMTKLAKKPLIQENINNTLQLLYMQMCAMNMYTSSGWFFADISSDECVHNLKCANTVLTLLEHYSSKIRIPFEEKLRQAKSNIPQYCDGKQIIDNQVYPLSLDYQHIVNNIVAVYRVNKSVNFKNFKIFTSFTYNDLHIEHLDGNNNLFYGEIEVTHKRICVPNKFVFLFYPSAGNAYRIYIAKSADKDKLLDSATAIVDSPDLEVPFFKKLTSADLADEIKAYILNVTFKPNVNGLINQNIGSYGDVRKIVIAYKNAGIALPVYLQSQLLIVADAVIKDISDKLDSFPTEDQYKLLLEIFTMLDCYKISAHVNILKEKITDILIEKLLSTSDILSQTYSDAIVLLQFCNKVGLMIERSRIENIVFQILKTQSAKILDILPSITDESERNLYMLQYKKLIIISDVCNISASLERKKMMNYLTNSEIDNPVRF